MLVAFDVRLLWAAGAATQVVVLILFAVLGTGVFDYTALSGLHMGLWATVITGVEVIVLGLLTYLVLTPSAHHNTPRSAAPGIGAALPT